MGARLRAERGYWGFCFERAYLLTPPHPVRATCCIRFSSCAVTIAVVFVVIIVFDVVVVASAANGRALLPPLGVPQAATHPSHFLLRGMQAAAAAATTGGEEEGGGGSAASPDTPAPAVLPCCRLLLLLTDSRTTSSAGPFIRSFLSIGTDCDDGRSCRRPPTTHAGSSSGKRQEGIRAAVG